jgi:arylsulfatase A-like enzyme
VLVLGSVAAEMCGVIVRRCKVPEQPNVMFFHVDNLGIGELGCYGGGVLRGADTRRTDAFAREGFLLLNYAPEAQCTPTRSALLTGRYSIRSGNHTVLMPGMGDAGLVAWEQTLGDVFSEAGYATMCLGKWHAGEGEGRWPTDHGFDEWYGIPHSYDECLWFNDPWYRPGRDPDSPVVAGRKGETVRDVGQLTFEVRRNIDAEFLRRAKQFMAGSAETGKPFFLYFNHSMMHLPVVPRDQYKGLSGNGDWADSLLELDGDFGELLDHLDALGLRDNTIVVFAGDNGNEDQLLHRGTSGFWEGSYFTGMEGSLRTPCLVRWPGHVAAGRQSNEIMHVTDWFATLLTMASIPVPNDRVIDGKDQSAFLAGTQEHSSRDGFIYWNGPRMYGVKWQNFKMPLVEQKYFFDPVLELPNPRIINLLIDPKEREPINPVYLHTWTLTHFGRLVKEFQESIQREPLIPAGAPLDYIAKA